jgi:YfiH family protein
MATIIKDDELSESGFYWRKLDGVQVLVCEALESAGFVNGFSTRLGGVSLMPDAALNLAGFNEDSAENILENRRRFLKLFPNDSAAWELAGCWQIHGSDVRLVRTTADAKPAKDAGGDTIYCDAIVSNAENVLAGMKTADCVPILIGDSKTRAFAAIHAGWRGTLAGVGTKALNQMTAQYQTDPRDVWVAIGPAAGSCCYEVGSDVIQSFTGRFPDQDIFTETRADHACVDLLAANRAQLIAAGVESSRIRVAPLCTMCRTDLFFSYRREKNVHGKVGRLMSVIGRGPKREPEAGREKGNGIPEAEV